MSDAKRALLFVIRAAKVEALEVRTRMWERNLHANTRLPGTVADQDVDTVYLDVLAARVELAQAGINLLEE